jgi:hypothetical protein
MEDFSRTVTYQEPINDVVDPFTLVYECPAQKSAEIESMQISNTEGLDYTIQVIKKGAGGVGNFFLFNASLDAGDLVDGDTIYKLTQGETIRFFSNRSSTQIIINGKQKPMPI